MGGKSGTTKSTVSIPPEVMARYNAVNEYASDVAKTPFQGYQGQFVAGLTPTQQAGIQSTSQYAQAAQPYFGAATQQLMSAQQSALPGISAAYQNVGGAQDVGSQYAQQATQGIGGALQYAQPFQQGATQAAMAGAQQLTPENINIQGFMSPYTQAVADTTYQALRQQQQQEMAGQTANAIRSGAFGGDRAGLVAANLARQQQLGTAQAMAPIYQQGYGQALGAAMSTAQANRAALQNLSQQLQGIGQQGYGQQMGAAQQLAGLGQQQYGQGLGAAQQLAALAQQGYGMGAGTAQQLAALGTGAQQSALQGAQAQMGAGTLEQQTQQADLTAQYQQFLQERGYPFQVAQFLANIAMGTGALSGNTTSTTQPMPFFSDRRVKHDVKEIGKTHDGQPIYSFKYNGDNSTQIGLMAQDVEKKHPEAVGEEGGIKTVDYKKATEGAEREERYAGGLVPASMGGAVTQPGAYSRGGYDMGGVVDPNDIQALISMQREALGPFGELGMYGGSPHEAPFSGTKGVVPTSRLHTPRMLTPRQAPPMPESGLSQAAQAINTAKQVRSGYEDVKNFLKEKTPQEAADAARPEPSAEDVAKMAGPDIVAKKAAEDVSLTDVLGKIFGFAEGGVVPRQHFVKGGTAFSDPYKPYEIGEGQVPEEVLDIETGAELQKPNTPQSQSGGSGLGTALTLAKFALGFFNQGGVVPRGHLQTGGVYDPTLIGTGKSGMVNISELTPEKIAELNKEDVYSRELQPAAAPRFRVFERIAAEEGAKGVKPTELYRSPERSAMLDLTMPEGAPRAKPFTSGHNYGLAVDYSGTTPENYDAIRKAAAATGLTSGLDFKNVDPPHVQLGKGGYGGLYGKNVAIDEGFGQRSQSGVVPAEAQEAAYAAARSAQPDLPAREAATASGGVKPRSPSELSWLAKNQSWLVPFGAGLRGMVQSRSPFLGGALLEGLGTGLEAIAPAQQQLAELEKARAAVYQTLSGIAKEPTVGELDPDRRLKLRSTGTYLDREGRPQTAAEQLGETQQKVIEQGAQAVGAPTSPIQVTASPTSYRYNVAPTSDVDKQFVQYGFTGQDPEGDVFEIRSRINMNPNLVAAATTDQKNADKMAGMAMNSGQIRRDTNVLTRELTNLTPDGKSLTSGGVGFDERTQLANVYNWLASFAGISDRIGSSSDIDAKQISDKINRLASTQFASREGFSGQELANSIKGSLPSGMLTENARLEMLSAMWAANQEAEDFDKYYKNYVARYGTALGVNQNFRAEMGQNYQDMKTKIKDFMKLRQLLDENGKPISGAQPDSYYNALMRDPSLAAEIDKTFNMPGFSRVFLGG